MFVSCSILCVWRANNVSILLDYQPREECFLSVYTMDIIYLDLNQIKLDTLLDKFINLLDYKLDDLFGNLN